MVYSDTVCLPVKVKAEMVRDYCIALTGLISQFSLDFRRTGFGCDPHPLTDLLRETRPMRRALGLMLALTLFVGCDGGGSTP